MFRTSRGKTGQIIFLLSLESAVLGSNMMNFCTFTICSCNGALGYLESFASSL